jgi:putative membrane protein
MPAFFAFLHHLAAFALVSALMVEFALLKGELNVRTARRIQIYDLVYGASAGIVLAVGVLRVIYFEKGTVYYLSSAPFIAKLVLFLAIGLLSIYPTMEFLSWSRHLRQGRVPPLNEGKQRRILTLIHLELAGVALLVLCAALMARGYGYVR